MCVDISRCQSEVSRLEFDWRRVNLRGRESTRFIYLFVLKGNGEILRQFSITVYRYLRMTHCRAFVRKDIGISIDLFLLQIILVRTMSSEQSGNPLRKFKLVFLGEQSGEFDHPTVATPSPSSF